MLFIARSSLEEEIMDANKTKHVLSHDSILSRQQHISLIDAIREFSFSAHPLKEK